MYKLNIKKLLSLLGAISLVGTSTTSLVACNTPQEYTTKELKELKKKNKINTTNQEIRDNLEWIAPQEKPFNTVDNKWYYIIYKDNSNNIKLSKRINNNPDVNIKLPWSNLWIKVYRWNGEEQNLPDLIVDNDGNVKVKEE
ncbi:lipoprotein [Spiroplasma endosymbiont of Poecilobothrus nobilitatus]|uniref:lipoprotein n=1 Tax=Spiroplasma endosymbiont of Poecilobothrus nobilitatus TaxID=1209220 RepID=UPI003CC7A0DA